MENNNPPSDEPKWFQRSNSLKALIIGVLTMLLLVPAAMISEIIQERQSLNAITTETVSNDWATDQLITGPVLTVPVAFAEGGAQTMVHLLPENYSVQGDAQPQELERGIYDVVVYDAALQINAHFNLQALEKYQGRFMDWENAYFTVGITDMRGIQNQIIAKVNDKDFTAEPGTKLNYIAESGITIPLRDSLHQINEPFDFSMQIDLKGSKNISVLPVGKTTEIQLASTWDSPGFNGAFLPDERNVTKDGFTANWKILELNRNYPQSWEANEYFNAMKFSAFGVDLIQPVDDYQKSTRSVKYAVLVLALTFLIFFLVEVINKTRIHPMQYLLVGLALCLFYILLISLSEQMTFNIAYFISAATIILMITFYSTAVFKSRKFSIFLFLLLIANYSFVFVTLQLSEYALLLGSIGLTLILGLTMYFTRKVNWYGDTVVAS